MIHNKFPNYENRIAVGLAGEGSDCFGYDDFMSRDHDFGTGVCLWLTEEDFEEIGNLLSIAYNELAMQYGGETLTERLMERRGVMTISSFYSNILLIDCNTKDCVLTDYDWLNMEHSCLATATNGEVFRDDLGEFTNFRNLLLGYYPDSIYRRRLVNEMHQFSASLQVNYGRCMSRGDLVAAELCRAQGLEAAMQLYFLLKRKYAPYYKWTYRALTELDEDGDFSALIRTLANKEINDAPWRAYNYNSNRINHGDKLVMTAEEVGRNLAEMMLEIGLIVNDDPYLESHIENVLKPQD